MTTETDLAAMAPLAPAVRRAREQHLAGGPSVLDALLNSQAVDSGQLAQRLLQELGVAVAEPSRPLRPDFSGLDRVTAQQWRCVVLVEDSGAGWFLAAEDPWNEPLIDKVAQLLARKAAGGAASPALVPMAATREMIVRWLALDEAPAARVAQRADSDRPAADGPIVGFVDQAILAALSQGASDVHFECDRAGITVRLRGDGVMAAFSRMDGERQAQEVVSRIKVMAQLDITERRVPQDGRIRFESADAALDLRVSIMPSVHGEDAVLRLLDKSRLKSSSTEVTLESLGFDSTGAALIRELANQPSGMVLVTGPTGSGKTTTVYAALAEINTGQEKIVTIEDPVEYELKGVLQIPVNERKGLTFAKGLRSILRHDPDRILVGEIRDAETAEIAVQSALTGHLVFTTVHANSVADVIGRFRHFGLDMFGFMSSLNGVVVQRLVRRLCQHCGAWRAPSDREHRWLQAADVKAERVGLAVGCPACHGTGYSGRLVVAEVHQLDDAFKDLVMRQATPGELKSHARSHGVLMLQERAAADVAAGRTTPEEVRRVIGLQGVA